MAKTQKSPSKPRNLDSFFPSASPSKRTAPSPPPPRKIARTDKGPVRHPKSSTPTHAQAGTGAANPVETVTLDDSSSSSDDDLLIVEPDLPTASIKGKGKLVAKAEPVDDKPPKPVASIFAKRTPAASTSCAPPSPALKTEDQGDRKPSVKPSPTKNISIFDTSAAASSSHASSSSGKGTSSKPLDTPLFSFSPSADVSFDPHSRTPFSYFTDALVLISGTKSRLAIQLVLTNLLRTVIEKDSQSLLAVMYLCSNRIGPSYERDTELGIGWQVLSKAIKETSGISPQRLKQLANTHGDPGDIAFEASKSVRLLVQPAPLVCHGVYKTLIQIAKLKGTGVLAQKTSLVKKLLLSAQHEQVRFVVRILASNLRIGAVRLTLLTALARAFCLSRPEGATWERDERYEVSEEERQGMREVEEEMGAGAGLSAAGGGAAAAAAGEEDEDVKPGEKGKGKGGVKGKGKAKPKTKPRAQRSALELAVDDKLKRAEALVRRVWARHPNFGDVVGALLAGGLGELEERVGLSVGIPLEPMLGSITRSLSDIYTRLGSRPFVSEAKLDGQRGQIHVFVPASPTAPARPPGVPADAGRVFTDAETGARVWMRAFSRHLEDMSDKYPDIGYSVLALVQRANAVVDKQEGDGPGEVKGDADGLKKDQLSSFIIDCEVVAIDPQTGAFKTFQELSYRSRKDVELGDIKVRVGIFCFDLMYLNDESLLSTPFRRRRSLLHANFPPLAPADPRFAKWELIPSCMDNDPAAVKAFFDEALGMRAEGIMVKLLDEVEIEGEEEQQLVKGEAVDDDLALAHTDDDDELGTASDSGSSRTRSPKLGVAGTASTSSSTAATALKSRRRALPATYEPDRRADSWCKVKKDYIEGEGAIGDSLDLVPIAGWWGQGRKAGWFSPFLLACYDEETGAYTAVTKCLSGFNDAFYKAMREKYRPDADNPLTDTSAWPEVEAGSLRPDVWFKPSEVWEIRGADFTLSPVYPAARTALGGERGVSIRFPRFIKVRDDKGIENATTAEQLARLYEAQGVVGGGGKKVAGKELEEEEGLEL
ncbi:hypothetical protein JCM9279_007096 [Rhodotorula babjevae]